MEIKLNTAYSSLVWGNIQYPVFKLSDDSYLCIAYEANHQSYFVNTYTKEEFIEEGFHENENCNYIFKSITREDIFMG